MNQNFKIWADGVTVARQSEDGILVYGDEGSNPSLRIELERFVNPAALFCMLLCLFSMHERLGSGQINV